MRLSSLHLLEALDPVAAAVSKFKQYAEKAIEKLKQDAAIYDFSPELLLRLAIDVDPDPKKKNIGWIIKQVKNHQTTLPEDSENLQQLLRRFIEQKRVGRIPVSDLNKYDKIDDLQDALERLGKVESKRQGGLGFDPTKMPGVETYAKKGPWVILRVTDINSLAELGDGCQWCTRKSYPGGSQAPRYLKEYGVIYIAFKNGTQYLQYTPDYSQIQRAQRTGWGNKPPRELAELMKPDPAALTGTLSSQYTQDVIQLAYDRLIPDRNPTLEHDFIRDLATGDNLRGAVSKAATYISNFGDPLPLIDDILQALAPYPYSTKSFNQEVLGRIGWDVIPASMLDAVERTHDGKSVIMLVSATKRRIKKFEKDWLFNDIDTAIRYSELTRVPIPNLAQRTIEHGTLRQIVDVAVVQHKAKQDTSELEEVLAEKMHSLSDLHDVLRYTKEVGPTPKINKRIMNSGSADFAIKYCRAAGTVVPGADGLILRLGTPTDVLAWMRYRGKLDWPEAEAVVARDSRTAAKFQRIAGRKPRNANDKRSVRPETPQEALHYAMATGNEYPEGEALILQDLDSALAYAESIIGPWPELEYKLKWEGTPEQKRRYVDQVLRGIESD